MTAQIRRWRKAPPDRDGWWKFREHSFSKDYEQRILVIDGMVADDHEWEDAMGRPPSETRSENYWEGNPVSELTDGTLTRGLWMYEGPSREGKAQ